MSANDDEFPLSPRFLPVTAVATSTPFGVVGTAFGPELSSTGVLEIQALEPLVELAEIEQRHETWRITESHDPSPGVRRITILLLQIEARHLDRLAEFGLYGASADDVATYLLMRGLDDLTRAGVIKLEGEEP